MSKVVQRGVDPFYFHYPSGATVVTSHAHGRDNAMAVAWHMAVSREPCYYVVSISPKRFTHELVAASGEFAVNFMSREMGEVVAQIGGCSGRDVDKLHAFSIASQPGLQVRAPVLEDALATYECRVVGRHPYGDHDLFVGEVVAVHWEESAFPGTSKLDLERAAPLLYLGEDNYATASQPVTLDRKALVRAVLSRPR